MPARWDAPVARALCCDRNTLPIFQDAGQAAGSLADGERIRARLLWGSALVHGTTAMGRKGMAALDAQEIKQTLSWKGTSAANDPLLSLRTNDITAHGR